MRRFFPSVPNGIPLEVRRAIRTQCSRSLRQSSEYWIVYLIMGVSSITLPFASIVMVVLHHLRTQPAVFMVTFGSGILPLAVGLVFLNRANEKCRKPAWLAHNVCPDCGYDLTGNVSGVCPGCGTVISGKAG
jgi:hypothetical protein